MYIYSFAFELLWPNSERERRTISPRLVVRVAVPLRPIHHSCFRQQSPRHRHRRVDVVVVLLPFVGRCVVKNKQSRKARALKKMVHNPILRCTIRDSCRRSLFLINNYKCFLFGLYYRHRRQKKSKTTQFNDENKAKRKLIMYNI